VLEDVDINWIAVIVAALVPMALGAVWYSPALFARPWMRAVGKTQEDMSMARRGYAVAAVAALAMAYVLARLVDYAGATTIGEGLVVGLFAWAGFVLTTMAVNGIFAGRSLSLYLIDSGYHGVSLLAMGAILAAWN